MQFTGHEDIRGKTWSTIKRRAIARGYTVDITIEDAWEIYVAQCKHCALSGLPIVFGKHNGETTASLDRIDSSKGYVMDNVQWVHKHVNIMKNVYSQEYFIALCKRIGDRHA